MYVIVIVIVASLLLYVIVIVIVVNIVIVIVVLLLLSLSRYNIVSIVYNIAACLILRCPSLDAKKNSIFGCVEKGDVLPRSKEASWIESVATTTLATTATTICCKEPQLLQRHSPSTWQSQRMFFAANFVYRFCCFSGSINSKHKKNGQEPQREANIWPYIMCP